MLRPSANDLESRLQDFIASGAHTLQRALDRYGRLDADEVMLRPSSMTAAVFVDTNVLVYARDAGEPVKQPARRELDRTAVDRADRQDQHPGADEYYVTVTRKLRPGMASEDAWADVHALLAWEPQPIDRDQVLRAREVERRHDLGWWDAMIVAAAQLQGCALLLTEDLQTAGAAAE